MPFIFSISPSLTKFATSVFLCMHQYFHFNEHYFNDTKTRAEIDKPTQNMYIVQTILYDMILVYKIYANAIDVWALALARYTILVVHCDWDSTKILSGLAVCFCLLARKWSRCAIWLCRWMCVCDSLVYIQFVLVNCNDTAGFFFMIRFIYVQKSGCRRHNDKYDFILYILKFLQNIQCCHYDFFSSFAYRHTDPIHLCAWLRWFLANNI